jgi:serine phosphatase RsbU (regulator of sigma subunit)
MDTSARMQCMEVWGGNSRVHRGFEVPGLDVWVYSRPYERAKGGGDVYYVSTCASGRITRLLLADVSGHGEAVADVAVGLRDSMRRNVNLINQTRFVREMNRQFSHQPDGEGFATALVCTFFSPTQSLQFCNAGHPSPYLYRADRCHWSSAEVLSPVETGIRPADTPLGVVEGADYSRFNTKLSQGDMMLCASDAFSESCNADGKLLGTDGLLQLIEELDASRPADFIAQLVDQVGALHDGNLSQDDATLILFRANGSTPSVKDNLLAPFRLLSPVRDNTGIN